MNYLLIMQILEYIYRYKISLLSFLRYFSSDSTQTDKQTSKYIIIQNYLQQMYPDTQDNLWQFKIKFWTTTPYIVMNIRREEGDIGSFITKSYFSFSHSLAYQPWGLLQNFDLLVYLFECPSVSTTSYNLKKG